MLTEFFHLLVQGETGRLGRNLEENATGLSEINRMKIDAIHHRRDIVAEIDEMLAPLELFGIVLCAKRNMMHRTGGDASAPGVGQTKHVNDSSRRRVIRRCKAKSISRFRDQTIAETVREQSGCS